MSDIVENPGDLILIDGESCLHRLFGGAWLEWRSDGIHDQCYEMIRNLEYFAYSKNAYIVIAFNGNISKLTGKEAFQLPGLKRYKLEEERLVSISKTVYNSPEPHKDRNCFVPPLSLRTFIRQYEHKNLTFLQTTGDHAEEIISWCRTGIPRDLIPDTWKTNGRPTALLGQRNEYILSLFNQHSVKYFNGPSFVLGRPKDPNAGPDRFKATCLIPDAVTELQTINETEFKQKALQLLLNAMAT